MRAVPAAIAATIPEAEPIVAINEALLLHTPPGVISLKVPVLPMQIFMAPEMGCGRGFTVTGAVMLQPAGTV
jgi:hypothetical protein